MRFIDDDKADLRIFQQREEFTAADVQISFVLEASAARAGLDARYPKLTAFLARIHARPAYQRALERGGKYAYAK